jgi:YVTN family beta-propeller protein
MTSFNVAISLLLIFTLFSGIFKVALYDQTTKEGSVFENLLSSRIYEQQASASIKWLNHEKPNLHLKMQYPSDWQKVENQNNITLLLPQKDSSVPFRGNFSIESYPSGNRPLDKLVSLKLLDYREHWSSFVLNNSITDIIGENITAYKIVYMYNDGNNYKPYMVMELWTIIDGKAYVIRYLAESASVYSSYLPTVEKIIDSIDVQRTATPKRNTQNYPALATIQDPYDVAVNPLKNVLYITNVRYDTISVIDGVTDKLLADIKVGNNPEGVAARSDREMIYVANSGSNMVSVIDGRTNRVLSNITVGLNPTDVATDGLEKGLDSLVFVVNTDSNTVSVINGRTNKVISNITVGDEPGSIILNPVTNRLYVTNADSNTVSMIDYFFSNQIFRTDLIANISVGSYPVNLELDQDKNRLYVTNADSNTVSVIDGATNKVIDTIPVGITPYSVALDKKSDHLYVSNYGSNTVSIINASTNDVISNLTVGRYPVNLEHNPFTDIVYVSNLGPKTLSEIKNTSLMTGVEFNVSPPEAGYLICNEDRIGDNDYIRYNFNSTVNCGVNPESDFEFGSWSGNVDFTTSVDPETTFKATKYGNVTANFVVPPKITLPEGYWAQLITILLTVMIPAIIGWFVPSIAGWVNGWRQRKNLENFVNELSRINNEFKDKDKDAIIKAEYLGRLETFQVDIKKALTGWKISETQYGILVDTISFYRQTVSGRNNT